MNEIKSLKSMKSSKILLIFALIFVESCSNSNNNSSVKFLGTWSCPCENTWDDYCEIEFKNDSIYWLTSEFTDKPSWRQIIFPLSPVPFFIRNDTLFEKGRNWYVTIISSDVLLITGLHKCYKINPKIRVSEWNDQNKEKIIADFKMRKRKANCP